MSTEYSPAPREIATVIFDLWKADPKFMNQSYAKILACIKQNKTDQHWVLSEKRLKQVMKEFNLQPDNQPKRTFLKYTTSNVVPNRKYPTGVTARMSKGRGKAMFATKSFKQGERIWEEFPLLPPAELELLTLKRKGMSCSYCGKVLRLTGEGKPLPRTGVPCINCTINWCSNNCKRMDIAHQDSYHDSRTHKAKVNVRTFKLYEQYCMDNSLSTGYLVGAYILHKIKNGPKSEFIAVMSGMASVKQDVKALAKLDPGFEYDQYIQQLTEAHALLAQALEPIYKLSFDEYLTIMGMININNVENCLFELYAHLNHNCEPNVKLVFKNDSRAEGIAVYATRDIESGEELTTTYVDPSLGLDERQSSLRVNWGFNCACLKCKRERDQIENPVPLSKPALKDPSETGAVNKPRSKSVHFESNPVASVSS